MDKGGALLLDQAIHAIDLLLWLFGPVAWVQGGTTLQAEGSSHEDTAVAQFQFTCGAQGTLAASAVANAMRDDIVVEVWGSEGFARLEIRDYDHGELVCLNLAPVPGERARALSAEEIEALVEVEGGEWRRGPTSRPWRLLAQIAGPERGMHPFRSPKAWLRRQADRVAQREAGQPQGHAAILAQMEQALREGKAPLVTGAEGRAALALALAIDGSAKMQGRRIDLGSRVSRWGVYLIDHLGGRGAGRHA